jgi:hypothetical protein
MIAKNSRAWAITAALAVGAAVGAAGIANAASGSSNSTPTTTLTANGSSDQPDGNPAAENHGPGETLLTGSALAKAKAAALAAVPGATVVRIETDSAGAASEAHLQKADGSYVTVKFDSNFNVTATQSGFGGGH